MRAATQTGQVLLITSEKAATSSRRRRMIAASAFAVVRSSNSTTLDLNLDACEWISTSVAAQFQAAISEPQLDAVNGLPCAG